MSNVLTPYSSFLAARHNSGVIFISRWRLLETCFYSLGRRRGGVDSLSRAWVGPIVLGYVSPVSPVSLIRAAFISCEFGSRDFSQVPLYCRCWSAFLSKCTWIHKSALLYVHARARIETHTRVKRRQRLYRFCIYLALNFFFLYSLLFLFLTSFLGLSHSIMLVFLILFIFLYILPSMFASLLFSPAFSLSLYIFVFIDYFCFCLSRNKIIINN